MSEMGEQEGSGDKFEDALVGLMNRHERYFVGKEFCVPTSRYEAWLLASSLSNILILKELKEIKKMLGDDDKKIRRRKN